MQSGGIMAEELDVSGVPMPDMKTIAEMHTGIAMSLANVQQAKKDGKKILWSSLIAPKEIFYAMDVPVMYQELLAGWVAILKLSAKYCALAEDLGFSRDICAVHRSVIGVAAAETLDPFFSMAYAVPDMVVSSNFPCISESRAFQFMVDRHGIPYYFLDAPINSWGGDIPDHAINYYVEQLKGLISFLESMGYKMNWDRLKEEVRFTKDLNIIMDEIDALRASIPTPMKAFDSFIAATAPLVLPQSMRKLEIFKKLRDEVKERVDSGIGVVKDEKIRLMWVGIPPVCAFNLMNYPEKYGAVVAKNMLEYLVGFPLDPVLLDPEKPLESLARGIIANPINPMYKMGIDYLVSAVKKYKIDGVISVVKRSCGLIPGMQRIVKERMTEAAGIPSVVFDLDGIDIREYDEITATENLDSFIESLIAAKKTRSETADPRGATK